MKKALITGITGQDGSYLTELLLNKGYEVHGIIRRASVFNTDRIDHIYSDPHDSQARLFLHYGDLTDGTGLRRILEQTQPDEIYNLGAQSHVRVSFDQAEYTANVVATGTLRLLEAVRNYASVSHENVRFYQAGSSEMFGNTPPPQNERSPFSPRSPYAVSKVAAHWWAVNYREAYGIYIVNGILFNHESPRRGARRDWGYAADYMYAVWLMLQQSEPSEYVIATGESHSVREFLDKAAAYLELDWQDYVVPDPRYLRPTEVDHLLGDPSRAYQELGWKPKVSFNELVRMMVEHDLELARQERTLKEAGHTVAFRGSADR